MVKVFTAIAVPRQNRLAVVVCAFGCLVRSSYLSEIQKDGSQIHKQVTKGARVQWGQPCEYDD